MVLFLNIISQIDLTCNKVFDMRNLFLALLTICALECSAQLNYEWGFALGDTTGGATTYAIAKDNSSNIIVCGSSYGTVDFDPGITTVPNTSPTPAPMVAKYSSLGVHLWSFVLPIDTLYSQIECCIVDNQNNVILGGYFFDTIDFDPGPGAAIKANPWRPNIRSAFVAMYDSNGTFLWVDCFYDTQFSTIESIATNASGNLFVVGTFWDSLDIDPGLSINYLRTFGVEGFVTCLDPLGQQIWQISNTQLTESVEITDIAISGNNKIILCGQPAMGSDIDFGSGVFAASSWTASRFIASYDINGNFIWGIFLEGGSTALTDQNIAVSSTKQIIIAGVFTNTIDMDPSTGTANVISTGFRSAFVGCYDSLGNYFWSGSINSDSQVWPYAICVDDADQVWIAGQHKGNTDFDMGSGATALPSTSGSADPFLAGYNSSGNLIAVFATGTSLDYEFGYGVISDGGVIYWTGTVRGAADWDPSSGSASLTGNGATSLFLVAYGFQNSLVDLSNEVKLSIFPNPATENIAYNLPPNSAEHTLVVVNNMGQIMFSEKRTGESGIIDVANWASGIYFLRVESDEWGVLTQKFVVR